MHQQRLKDDIGEKITVEYFPIHIKTVSQALHTEIDITLPIHIKPHLYQANNSRDRKKCNKRSWLAEYLKKLDPDQLRHIDLSQLLLKNILPVNFAG